MLFQFSNDCFRTKFWPGQGSGVINIIEAFNNNKNTNRNLYSSEDQISNKLIIEKFNQLFIISNKNLSQK